MADVAGALATAGLCIGAYIVWEEHQRGKGTTLIINPPAPQPVQKHDNPRPLNPAQQIFGLVFDMIGQKLSKNTATGGRRASGANVAYPSYPTGGTAPQGLEAALLALIGSIEAPQGYDQVYGGSRIATPRRLTQMTVGEVLQWQDRSVAAGSASSAAGRYQIIRKTLRGLANKGYVRHSDRFDKRTQDRLGVVLMEQRGLRKYQAGRISATQFGQNLSQEWASLPAITKDKRGRNAKGQSYYAGDGLNHARTSQRTLMNTITGGAWV